MPKKNVLIDLTDEEVELLKHSDRRLKLDEETSKNWKVTGSVKKAVQYAAKTCARIEKEIICLQKEKAPH